MLARFKAEERDVAGQAIGRAADAVETFVERDIMAAMNQFNAAGDKEAQKNEEHENSKPKSEI